MSFYSIILVLKIKKGMRVMNRYVVMKKGTAKPNYKVNAETRLGAVAKAKAFFGSRSVSVVRIS